jgi:hypothetical protein
VNFQAISPECLLFSAPRTLWQIFHKVLSGPLPALLKATNVSLEANLVAKSPQGRCSWQDRRQRNVAFCRVLGWPSEGLSSHVTKISQQRQSITEWR